MERTESQGVLCLHIGRSLSRAECGLAVAARAIIAGSATDLRMGLSTVLKSVEYARQMFPRGAAKIRKIESQVRAMNGELDKKKRISSARSKGMLTTIRSLGFDVDQLFVRQGNAACSGGKKRRV